MVRDESGLATGFETEGDFPKYGNDDDRADEIGVWLLTHLPGDDQEAPHLPQL